MKILIALAALVAGPDPGPADPPEVTKNTLGMAFAALPPGRFVMGSSREYAADMAKKVTYDWYRESPRSEAPPREVTLTRGFALCVHETRLKDFRAFVQATGYRTDAERDGLGGDGRADGKWTDARPAFHWREMGYPRDEDEPVVNVSWNDAVAFCAWLSKKEGATYRLPTEAEWEYACRAGTTGPLPWGDDESRRDEHAWSGSNSGDRPHRVMTRRPNAWGLHDMLGNAYEYGSDRWSTKATDTPLTDPTGPSNPEGEDRIVVRGGSWGTAPNHCRSAFRGSAARAHRNRRDGFRVVLETARPAARFPLKVSGDRRRLEDSEGRPFLVVGDTAWSLIAQLTEEEIATYLDDRAGRGFNAIIVSLIEHKFAERAPAKIDGVRPFPEGGDFTRPEAAYFDYAHRAIAEANRRGISVWLCPAYLGVNGGDEGFFREIKAAGPKALRAYGKFVGERFRDLPNIVWMPGGDYAMPEAERWAGTELAEGIREGGATQIMTAHGCQHTAIETFGEPGWLAVDNVYSYRPDSWKEHRANYRNRVVRPSVLLEAFYEHEYNGKASPQEVRAQAWWAMLNGACGQFFGNTPIWHFGAPAYTKTEKTWRQALGDRGSLDMARLAGFFRARPWEALVADLDDALVTAGGGGDAAKVTAARTPDRRLAILYVPSDGRGERDLTLDLSSFPGPVAARWFNPARDAEPAPLREPIPNRAGRAIRTPGDNGTGTNDWVLVLEPSTAEAALPGRDR